jgi:D-alanyl-D-alanine-carboxypeptidase/D-alanyl-D-alanine-endopeptidase
MMGALILELHSRAAWAAPEQHLSKAAIREILAARIDRQRNGVGLVAGVVAPNGRQRVGYGRIAGDDPRTPDANTVFEIASLTKIFTGLIFAGMVQRGKIGLEDPLSRTALSGKPAVIGFSFCPELRSTSTDIG